jgi:hypothetical protein
MEQQRGSGVQMSRIRQSRIAEGDAARATKIAADHVATARGSTLAAGADKAIEARVISNDR